MVLNLCEVLAECWTRCGGAECLIEERVCFAQGKNCPVEAWCPVLFHWQSWEPLLLAWEQCSVHSGLALHYVEAAVEPSAKHFSVAELKKIKVAVPAEWSVMEAVHVSF